ncbi:hypothetical protein GJ496_002918 [Pomphorhynchus laevis]|nr:hypothetical protein GJ496_002918 [Pomphorhynchus laevis]
MFMQVHNIYANIGITTTFGPSMPVGSSIMMIVRYIIMQMHKLRKMKIIMTDKAQMIIFTFIFQNGETCGFNAETVLPLQIIRRDTPTISVERIYSF